MIKGILAVDKNYLMGKDLELPWKNRPDTKWDLENFKNLTSNQIIYMGFNTYLSLPKSLPNRINIVEITRNLENPLKADFLSSQNFEDFIKNNSELCQKKDIFIIGGKKIFEKYINQIQELYLTQFNFECQGNIYFNESLLSQFSKKELISSQPNGSIYKFSK